MSCLSRTPFHWKWTHILVKLRVLSLLVGSGASVFVAGCDPFCALQACMEVGSLYLRSTSLFGQQVTSTSSLWTASSRLRWPRGLGLRGFFRLPLFRSYNIVNGLTVTSRLRHTCRYGFHRSRSFVTRWSKVWCVFTIDPGTDVLRTESC